MKRKQKQPSRAHSALGATVLTLALGASALALDPTTLPEVRAFAPVVAPPRAPDGLPPPLGGVAFKMGRRNWINGQLVDLDSYYSKATLGDLVDYYAEALSSVAAERTSVQRMELGAVTYLSAIGEDGTMRSVMLTPQSDGTTLVVPSVSRGEINPGGEAASVGIPIPAAARALSTMETEDPGCRAAAAHYVDPRPVAEVAEEMARELPAAGFVPERQPDVPITEEGTRLLRYRTKDGDTLNVGLHPLGDPGTMVYVLRSKDRTPKLH